MDIGSGIMISHRVIRTSWKKKISRYHEKLKRTKEKMENGGENFEKKVST